MNHHLGTFTNIEAHLLSFYCNYYRELNYKSALTKYDEITKQDKLTITTIGETEEGNLLRIINNISYKNYDGTSLDYLLKKIDLFENVA